MANIPPKANRKWKNCFSPFLYRNRNAIERMFCRLKDFRRVATRYDRNAVTFLAAVCIAATISCESKLDHSHDHVCLNLGGNLAAAMSV
jgi:transposase